MPCKPNFDSLSIANVLVSVPEDNNFVKLLLTTVLANVGEVQSMALHGNRLFVFRYKGKQIEVYNIISMQLQRVMDLATTLQSVISNIGDIIYGLAACATYNCLYVSLHQANYVCKFQMANYACERAFSATQPSGLSINIA
jgi:hypothetical protein